MTPRAGGYLGSPRSWTVVPIAPSLRIQFALHGHKGGLDGRGVARPDLGVCEGAVAGGEEGREFGEGEFALPMGSAGKPGARSIGNFVAPLLIISNIED